MNRVRIVALAAVGLGVAVVAGTKFQQQRELSAMADARAAADLQAAVQADAVAAPQLASAVPTPQPAQQGPVARAPEHVVTTGLPPEVAAVVREEAARANAGAAQVQVAQAPSAAGSNTTLIPQSPLAAASVVPQSDLPVVTLEPEGPQQAGFLEQRPQLPAFPPAEPVQATGVSAEPIDPELQAELENCAVWVVVTPAPGAMLDMSVYAPCDQEADVTVQHAGLSIDTRVAADGQMMMMIPALAENATVSVHFADGREQSDTTFVPDLAGVERVALQWSGAATMLLHAYEFGADFGETGHVHAGNPLAPGVEGHGFLTVLADERFVDGQRAQVYSYPAGEMPRTGSVRLEIEAPITDASCGQSVEANALELHGASAGQARVIRIDMPACDDAGGYVVLPGVLPDLQIALN